MIKWFQYNLIKKSGLFDFRYYLRANKDVRQADIDPLLHFIKYGWKEWRNPSGNFNTQYYLEMNPDVQRAGVNPLVHYIRFGKKEGRKTHSRTLLELSGAPIQEFSPFVSIIVPSYNHESFLTERLCSIYSQTYQNFEVILLDDCSDDKSRDILQQFEDQYPQNTCCVFNDLNSGSPFSQWKKGISLARGDLIWIAESDDFCEKDFLDKLIPNFFDETVMLAYAHTIFVDSKSRRHPFAFESYVSQIDKQKWNTSYIETAHNEVRSALGLLNTIPNVSSVIFRSVDENFPLFSNPEWEQMKVCGDWLFYLYLIRGGNLAYSTDTHAYYRIHSEGSSKKAQTQEHYYREHEIVAKRVANLYNVPESLLHRFEQRLLDYYLQNVEGSTQERFAELFDLRSILKEQNNRLPNILVGIYGFAFGGGEIFPIRLANEMYLQGAAITVLNGGFEEKQQGVRKMLIKQIPVIHYKSGLNLESELLEMGIEIIHTHHASMEHLIAITTANTTRKARHIATTHGMYEMMEKFQLWTKDILRSVDHWVYTADKNIEPFKNHQIWNPNKFIKIENGVSDSKRNQLDLSNLGITANSVTVCLASRALKEKGWYEAIEAIKITRKATGRDIHLLLIGEGPVYDELMALPQENYVHLLGYKANLGDYLCSSHFCILPTYFKGESFPLIIIECFLAGIPVIATRIGEIESMMTSQNNQIAGSLFNLSGEEVDPVDLAEKMIQIITDQDYFENAKQIVEELKPRFDLRNVAKRYIQLFQSQLKIQ